MVSRNRAIWFQLGRAWDARNGESVNQTGDESTSLVGSSESIRGFLGREVDRPVENLSQELSTRSDVSIHQSAPACHLRQHLLLDALSLHLQVRQCITGSDVNDERLAFYLAVSEFRDNGCDCVALSMQRSGVRFHIERIQLCRQRSDIRDDRCGLQRLERRVDDG